MSFCTLTLSYFFVSSVFDQSQTSLNLILWLSIITHITLEIELFTVLNSFAGAVKNLKTYWSSISIRISSDDKLIRYLS